MRKSAALVFVLTSFVACASRAPQEAATVVVPDSPSSNGATTASGGLHPPVPPADPKVVTAGAWADDSVITTLAKDCSWKPEDGSALACSLFHDNYQGCAPDPCHDTTVSTCRPACKQACDSCSLACDSPCTVCEASCHDDACKRECAKKTAACHQACVVTADQCGSAKCSAEYQACRKKTPDGPP